MDTRVVIDKYGHLYVSKDIVERICDTLARTPRVHLAFALGAWVTPSDDPEIKGEWHLSQGQTLMIRGIKDWKLPDTPAMFKLIYYGNARSVSDWLPENFDCYSLHEPEHRDLPGGSYRTYWRKEFMKLLGISIPEGKQYIALTARVEGDSAIVEEVI